MGSFKVKHLNLTPMMIGSPRILFATATELVAAAS
jgi:hypothetical protein